jgi:hypothetical protein
MHGDFVRETASWNCDDFLIATDNFSIDFGPQLSDINQLQQNCPPELAKI